MKGAFMKKYIKCVNEGFIEYKGETIYVDSDGDYYIFVGKQKIGHPDIDELKRKIDEIHQDKTCIRKYIGSSSKWPYWVEGDNDTDVVVFFYDEDLRCYRGEGDVVASKGETLEEAVYNAKQVAKNYDRYFYDNVKFKESVDYDETYLDNLGEMKIFWHTR